MHLLKKFLTTPIFRQPHQDVITPSVATGTPAATGDLVRYEEIEQAQKSINIDWDTQSVDNVVDRLNAICVVVGGFITRYNNLEKVLQLTPSGQFREGMTRVYSDFQFTLRLRGDYSSAQYHVYRCEVQVMQVRKLNETFFNQFLANLKGNLANKTYRKDAGAMEIAAHIQQKEHFIADVNTLIRYAGGIIQQSSSCFSDLRYERSWTDSYRHTVTLANEETKRGYTQALRVLELKMPPVSLEEFQQAANQMINRLEAFRKYVIDTLQDY